MGEYALRSGVVRSAETFATDLALGERFGDPHVAFVALVYPDREPRIVALTDYSPRDLKQLQAAQPNDDTASGSGKRFFSGADLQDAERAFRDAHMAIAISRRDDKMTLGVQIGEQIRRGWQRARDFAVENTMKAAAEDARRPHKCPFCRGRYTVRGWPMHVRRAPYCTRRASTFFESLVALSGGDIGGGQSDG